MEKTGTWTSIIKNFHENKKAFIRLWLILSLIHLIGFLLGFGIWLIIIGIQIMVTRIIIYWTPARKWASNIFGLKFHHPQSTISSPLHQWVVIGLRSVTILILIAIGFYVISLGIEVIIKDGFLEQNLIYLIFSTDP